MEWIAILLLLSLFQVRLYRISARALARAAVYYVGALFFGLLAAQKMDGFLAFIGLDWWSGVVISFVAFLIGETFSFLFQNDERMIRRKVQAAPSFLAFSALFVALARVHQSQSGIFFDPPVVILMLPIISFFLSAVFFSLSEKLTLSDVPKSWQGIPVTLISAGILLLGLQAFLR